MLMRCQGAGREYPFTFPTDTVCTWIAFVEDGAVELVEDGALSLDTFCEYPNWVETTRQSRVAMDNIFICFWL